MPRCKLVLGKDAVVCVLLRYLHPSEHILAKFNNPTVGQKLENCTVLWQEVKKISHCDQLAVVLCHNDFKNGDNYIMLHAAVWWVQAVHEGPPDFFFTNEAYFVAYSMLHDANLPGTVVYANSRRNPNHFQSTMMAIMASGKHPPCQFTCVPLSSIPEDD